MLGLDFLRVLAVTRIPTVVSTYGVFLIAQMGIQLTFKHLFQYLRMQLLQELAYIGFCLELAKELLT